MVSSRPGALIPSAVVLACLLAQACAENHREAGSEQGSDAGGDSASVGSGGEMVYATVADCPTEVTSFDAPPTENDGGFWSPAVTLDAALGTWSNLKTDTLTIERVGPLTEHRRTGRLRPGGTRPTDCAYYNDFTLPVRVSLQTKDGRLNETFEATLLLDGRMYVGFQSELALAELKGSLSSAEPNDGMLSLSVRFSARGALHAPALTNGSWDISAQVAAKPIVMGNAATGGAALIWIDDFDTRIDDVLIGP